MTDNAHRRSHRTGRAAAVTAAVLALSLLAASCSSTPEPEASAPETTGAAPETAAPPSTQPEAADTAEAAPTTEAAAPATTAVATTTTPTTLPPTTVPPTTTTTTEEPKPEEPPREPVYENKSPNSVFPDEAYYDHTRIRELFPDCPPPSETRLTELIWYSPAEAAAHFDFWDSIYANWDTDSVEIRGTQIASGWWTDDQLYRWVEPNGSITAASAREEYWYHPGRDEVGLSQSDEDLGMPWPEYIKPYRAQGGLNLEFLYYRAASRGYESNYETGSASVADDLRHIRDSGMLGNEPNPQRLQGARSLAGLLWEWAFFRAQVAPTTREPAHWPMRTLLTTREPTCVVSEMQSICRGHKQTDNDLLDKSDRFGRVLWSLICPEDAAP